jgi:hypothetical protein
MSFDKALASIPSLDDDNWHIWKPLMLSILHLKGIPKLDTLDLSRPTHKTHDMDAHALLTLAVGPYHLPIVVAASTGKEAFSSLEALYTAHSSARVMQLNDKLAQLKKGMGETILFYCNRARQLQQDLQAAGQTVADSQLFAFILRGLPVEYNVIRTLLKSRTNLTFSELLNTLLSVEQEVKTESETADNAAFMASKKPPWRKDQGGSHHSVVCTYCHLKGHTESVCRRKAKAVEDLKAAAAKTGHVAFMGLPAF